MTSAVAQSTEQNALALSQELKTHTARAHQQAEHSSFMDDLLGGRLDSVAFIRLQEQSWLFYTALEEAARAVADDSRAGSLLDPRLERTAALDRDLTLLHGGSRWRPTVHASPATAAYVSRLRQIRDARDFPRLLAHHYVRYLGDLSGGQIISRIVAREYGVDETALSFYRFEGIDKLKPYKDGYRNALDSLFLSGPERRTLLNEAAEAFTFNQQVFADLG
ncbi:heme oxygenase (biliverdin-producing) [Corynebacterium pacaense]|uniref:biliverdin-producing heme oxygenase n=1 Tax=Corynebacterium pacaense TaxID=1816684 RepID=UPI0009BBF830|nr:biliverdin-producing heme oxygenase [Corynebacterium pacaense]